MSTEQKTEDLISRVKLLLDIVSDHMGTLKARGVELSFGINSATPDVQVTGFRAVQVLEPKPDDYTDGFGQ